MELIFGFLTLIAIAGSIIVGLVLAVIGHFKDNR